MFILIPESQNYSFSKEPFISLIIAWIMDNKSTETDKDIDIDVSNIKDDVIVDIDEKDNSKSSMRVKNVRGKAKVFINKGKDTLNNPTNNNP